MSTKTFAPDPFSGRNEAICRLGGLEDLYIKSVKSFQANYQDSHAVLSGLVNQKRYEEARIYAHSLKGLAATLGMQNLSLCCQSIENAIIGAITTNYLTFYGPMKSLSSRLFSLKWTTTLPAWVRGCRVWSKQSAICWSSVCKSSFLKCYYAPKSRTLMYL